LCRIYQDQLAFFEFNQSFSWSGEFRLMIEFMSVQLESKCLLSCEFFRLLSFEIFRLINIVRFLRAKTLQLKLKIIKQAVMKKVVMKIQVSCMRLKNKKVNCIFLK